MFYEAIFEPSRIKDYNSEAKKLSGKRIALQAGWIIEEGVHKGEQCFYIPNSKVGTIPGSDLKELKPISIARWKDIQKSLGFIPE
ncbi:MAG TPA: hypothetical protein HPQ03_06460 [Deltaproteobacteria bacterium]|nr:hypothetical protein [Deltaproteobacteria bacterium]